MITFLRLSLFIPGLSYNQPKFPPSTTWVSDAITFVNRSVVGSDVAALFVNTADTVYVATRKTREILVWYNNSATPMKITSGDFLDPNSLFVTTQGDIYIDNGKTYGRVDKWISNTKTWISVINVDSACFGVFVDINDTLYCSMVDRHQVVKKWLHDHGTTPIRVAGTGLTGLAPDRLGSPQGIFVHTNFDLYVADCQNNRIQLFHPGELNGITIAGVTTATITISLKCPSGIILDADNYPFILDNNNHRIVGSDINGFRCLVGCVRPGSASDTLLYPYSFGFDTFGNIFVADKDNHRIQKFFRSINSSGRS